MANNHQGSVEHAKKIVDDFADLANKRNLNAGVKLQFRNLDTFIHPDYKNSDLKYVKRFNDTRLSKEEFKEIIDYIHFKGLTSISTPFDNESLPLFDELGVEVLKIASCSSDDWPLLEKAANINRKIIISTGGATIKHLNKVYSLFKRKGRDFAFLHCIAEYPTLPENAFLDRIKKLREEFPDIEIGYSTHESPKNKTVIPYAVAMGATIIEKHVGKTTETISLNDYSCTVEQMADVIDEVEFMEKSSRGEFSTSQALEQLKRGMYLKYNMRAGDQVLEQDLYYAMPLQEGCLNASNVYDIVGKTLLTDLKGDQPLKLEYVKDTKKEALIEGIKQDILPLLNKAGVTVTHKDDVELSCHFGLDKYRETGALIVSKINRTYY